MCNVIISQSNLLKLKRTDHYGDSRDVIQLLLLEDASDLLPVLVLHYTNKSSCVGCGHSTRDDQKNEQSHMTLVLPPPTSDGAEVSELLDQACQEFIQDEAKYNCSNCNKLVKLKTKLFMSGDSPDVLMLSVNRGPVGAGRHSIKATVTLNLALWGSNCEHNLIACLFLVNENHHTASVREGSSIFV